MSAGAAAQIEDMCPAELDQRKNLVDFLLGRFQSFFWEYIGIHFPPEVFVFKPFGHRTPASCFEERQDPSGNRLLGADGPLAEFGDGIQLLHDFYVVPELLLSIQKHLT